MSGRVVGPNGLCSNVFGAATRPTGIYGSSYSSSKLEVVDDQRSTQTRFTHPSSVVRATMAREAARSIRRSQLTRRSLAAGGLRPWLEIVDATVPDLTDEERLRLAGIAQRCLGPSTPGQPPQCPQPTDPESGD